MKKWMFYLLICTLCMSAGPSVGFRSTDETKKSSIVKNEISKLDLAAQVASNYADITNLISGLATPGQSEIEMIIFNYEFIKSPSHFTLHRERLKLNNKPLIEDLHRFCSRDNC